MLKTTCCLLVAALATGGLCLRAADNKSGDDADEAPASLGTLRGITRSPGGAPLTSVKVVVHNVSDNTDRSVISGGDGAFVVENLKSGRYQLTAVVDGASGATPVIAVAVDVAERSNLSVDLTLVEKPTSSCPACKTNFFQRLAKAYADDWNPKQPPGPDPPFRGFPAPVTNPPWPYAVWPYGGSPVIGQPNTILPPLMQAIYAGPNGKEWQDSKIQIYGWVNTGFNVSSSNKPGFSNAPAAYALVPNSIQLDQLTMYVERVPDTVQNTHFDWGFRFTALYGMDYRFTTSKGIFSNQLLGKNQKYGFDPVMDYIDMYWGQVLNGLNVRIGRYVSLPDIEAQLAPNNSTYSHSLTYTYDCYTQSGVNATLQVTKHWMFQGGLSAGCDSAPWTSDAKLTGNACASYTFREGGDNIYVCANSINDGKYAYNNLSAYYLTWYHKINANWHFATESWYQYMKDVPSIFGSIPTETNSNGAWCAAGQQRCYAPEFAVLNYVERQLSNKNYFSIRNEFLDDIKGQRTGVKTRYSEHMIAFGHWVGTSILFRPEIRFERAYDHPSYDNGTKKNQLMLAGDVIFFY